MLRIYLAELLNALQAQDQRRVIRQEKFMEGASQAKMQVQEGDKGLKKYTRKTIKVMVAAIKEPKTFLFVNTVRKQITYKNIVGGDLM